MKKLAVSFQELVVGFLLHAAVAEGNIAVLLVD